MGLVLSDLNQVKSVRGFEIREYQLHVVVAGTDSKDGYIVLSPPQTTLETEAGERSLQLPLARPERHSSCFLA